MTKEPYTYMILRYRHDAIAGELVNVGVVLHAPRSSYLGAEMRKAYGRVARIFPTVNGAVLRRDLATVIRAFRLLGKQNVAGDLFSNPDVSTFARQVVGDDEGSLVWSEVRSGLTSDPAKTLAALHARFVTQYDDPGVVRRTDADVWKPFRDLLIERQIADVFQQKTITGAYDEVEFDHAWKNGKWHCLQPLSFDLLTAEGIQEKAARWVGHMVGLNKSAEDFQAYFIVGEPTDSRLKSAYSRALEFIGAAPLHPRVIVEDELSSFADTLADQVSAHAASAR